MVLENSTDATDDSHRRLVTVDDGRRAAKPEIIVNTDVTVNPYFCARRVASACAE